MLSLEKKPEIRKNKNNLSKRQISREMGISGWSMQNSNENYKNYSNFNSVAPKKKAVCGASKKIKSTSQATNYMDVHH